MFLKLYEPGNRFFGHRSLRRTLVRLYMHRQSKIPSTFQSGDFRSTRFSMLLTVRNAQVSDTTGDAICTRAGK